jgi:hypothetical protein
MLSGWAVVDPLICDCLSMPSIPSDAAIPVPGVLIGNSSSSGKGIGADLQVTRVSITRIKEKYTRAICSTSSSYLLLRWTWPKSRTMPRITCEATRRLGRSDQRIMYIHPASYRGSSSHLSWPLRLPLSWSSEFAHVASHCGDAILSSAEDLRLKEGGGGLEKHISFCWSLTIVAEPVATGLANNNASRSICNSSQDPL